MKAAWLGLILRKARGRRSLSFLVSPAVSTFSDRLAFIGLSQVRESAVFSGIPLVKRAPERVCGVWVVHIATGETVGFLRFERCARNICGAGAARDALP